MLKYDSIVQYSRTTNSIYFPQKKNTPFLLVYFSENSTLIEDYPHLNIRKVDVRYVVIPITKIPITRLTPELRSGFKKLKLIPLSSNMALPKDKNLLYDLTIFEKQVDKVLKPTTYRQRAGYLLQDMLMNSFMSFPNNYRKVLVYSVDLTKPINTFVNRRIFPLIQQLRHNQIFFDDLLLVTLTESDTRYRMLIKDGEYQINRIIQYLFKLKTTAEETSISTVSSKILKVVSKNVVSSSKTKSAIERYLTQNPDVTEKIQNDELSTDEIKRLALASILFSTNGDVSKANRLAQSLPKKNLTKALSTISQQYKDDLLEHGKSENLSTLVLSTVQEPDKRVDNKTPEHIFNKRKVDFEINLKKDLSNTFRIFENRDIPLKFQSVTIQDKPKKNSEILPSDESLITVKLKDKQGKVQEISFVVPKIDPETGTFRLKGKRKCLINQMILNPITFPKPYDSKFESSYSSFHVYSKRTKRLKYLEIYIGSFRLPLLIMLAYSFGFDTTLKQYKISYKIVNEKPASGEYFCKGPSSYIWFNKPENELQEELILSFTNAKIDKYDIDKKFLSKEYFSDLIVKMTSRIDSIYLIDNNLQNIVDPVAKQILINQQLPYELPQIIHYMASKCITGFAEERNDITNQRIRNSEVIVHLVQKQLLKAYTEYREQYLAGNKDAVINFPENAILSQFIMLELVQDMEYANPVEEMATITKVTPVGKSVGGIPDKVAIQLDARNVHPSYFGNIDPLDTAEGQNIGIVQQLTVNAYITSSRGLFAQKQLSDKEKSGILSTSASMVPFVENNEGARILMATNQAKQMLPLKNPEPPICQTGYESLLTNVLSDNFVKRSPCKGKVSKVTSDYISIACTDNKKHRIDITPVQLKSGSGKNTLSTFTPIVSEGQIVKKGELLAEGGCISNGTISLGRNLACCYMPYKGYNFEDGIVISSRLVEEDKLTSLHGVDIEATVEKGDKVLEIVELGKNTIKGEVLLRKFPAEIQELLTTDEEDENIELASGEIIVKSPGGRVVDIQVYCNINPKEFPILEKHIERTNKRFKVSSAREKFSEGGVTIKGIKIIFRLEQELKIGIGDKLCNRYGNKGIVSLIEDKELMPRTPWGEHVDIIFNPLGVLNRMNVGQLYELYCGLVSKYISSQIKQQTNKTKIIELLGTVMTYLDTDPSKSFSKKFIQNLKKLSNKQFKKMIDQTVQTGFFPITIPPFQAPTYKQILPLLKKLALKTGYHMTLPEFGTKTKNEVPFGYLYVAKLEHIGEMKAHARSTGPMVSKTLQPTAGKRQGGGQRLGEADTWALASYNATKLISEMLGPLSDDVRTKNEIIAEIIQTGSAKYREPKMSPTRNLLKAYFIGMMLR